LRARVISEGAPYVQDAVVTGINRDDIGLMVFPRVDDCRRLSGLPPQTPLSDVLASHPVREAFSALLARLNASAGGSATYVARLMLLDTPPSLDRGEVTDKGSINQRAVQDQRAAAVDGLHAAQADDRHIILAPARH
jgi:feruloyl-CoA synthase